MPVRQLIVILMIVGVSAYSAAAEVVIETVPVGNPGNAGELSGDAAGGSGPDAIVGAVSYIYDIGKFEVTAGQYTEFLNAVADTDTYELYTTAMDPATWNYGCGIVRNGLEGGYTYSLGAGWANHPVNYVSWGDAARFANWLYNGQPTGRQGLATTEGGSYYLNGATDEVALMAVSRKPGATWVLPTEDEWYKAAYHRNDGATGNYWDFPTGTNATPDNGPADTGNSANYFDGEDYTVGYPYYTTNVGTFGLSESPYGTFDQGGNVREWNEADINGSRGWRGGSWYYESDELLASQRNHQGPTAQYASIGFRLALVASATFLEADFDEDGDVDGDDLARWQAGYSLVATATHGDGDADCDGDIDGRDFLIWQRQFGSSVPLGATAGLSTDVNAAVPEPAKTSTTLVWLTVCYLVVSRNQFGSFV